MHCSDVTGDTSTREPSESQQYHWHPAEHTERDIWLPTLLAYFDVSEIRGTCQLGAVRHRIICQGSGLLSLSGEHFNMRLTLCLRVWFFLSQLLGLNSFSFSSFANMRRFFRIELMGATKGDADASPFVRTNNRPSNHRSGEYDYNQWKKAFRSQLNEFDYVIAAADIEGKIPPDLQGTLFRSMPSRFERGDVAYGHYLDGDGYIARLSIRDGKVSFKSKFVQTEAYVEEETADSIIYRNTFRTQRKDYSNMFGGVICPNNAFDLKLKNSANTNAVYWAERLMVFFEAGLPHRIDPCTLDTIGEDSMEIGIKSGMSVVIPNLRKLSKEVHDNLFGSSMTAHPKIDKEANRMVSWSWAAEVDPLKGPLNTNPRINIYEWDEDMQPVGSIVTHKLQSTSVSPHDFSITPHHYVFIENRVSGDTLPYILGTKCPAACVDIQPSKNMILNVVDRPSVSKSPASMEPIESTSVCVSLAPGFTIHSVCAFENIGDNDGIPNETGGGISNSLELLTTAWKGETVVNGGVKGGLLGAWEGTAPVFSEIPVTLLYRTIIDLESKKLISHEPVKGMENTIVEHPHINPDYEGKKVRFVYLSLGSQTGISSPPLGYMKLDLLTGEKQEWYAPEHTYCEEVVIVPKKANGDENFDDVRGEDAVWILGSMFDAVENKSCVGIFDGQDMSMGPVATVWLSHHLPHSLHGNFAYDKFFDDKII